MNRREFIKLGSAFTAAIIVPSISFAKEYEKSIRLYHRHTGEYLKATFWADGEYIYDELENIDYFFRDYRTDEMHKIDVRLIEYLYEVQKLAEHKEIHIVSGYRSPQTNNYLRRHSGGVAKKSFHLKGKAADITVPGLQLHTLKYAALSLKRGGVGYYPQSNFVHLDTGMPRYWRYPKI